MAKALDLVGQRFGRLTVTERTENNKHGNSVWICKCDCGKTVKVVAHQLICKKTQSCGCLKTEQLLVTRVNSKRRENLKSALTTHGGSETRLYRVYYGMLTRCFNKKHKSFNTYGGRGITVCDDWKDNFSAFQEWAMANGYDETAQRGQCTIDRIDVNGNYCPENCRWVDAKTQASNKRNNKKKETPPAE